jgi:thiamine-phosphate pyrophosphorylase
MPARDVPSACLYLVTSRRRTAPDARTDRAAVQAVLALIEEAAAAGVDLIQIRELDLATRDLCALSRDAIACTRGTATRVLVNERADVAFAAGAAGVHLRSDSAPADRVRPCSPDWLIGRSVHAPDDAANAGAVDFLVFGTIARTISKRDEAPVAGVEGLRAVVAAAGRTPVLAIGGITPEVAEECAAAGAAGVAAIGLFLPPGREPGALGPRAATRALKAALSRGAAHRR